MGDGNKPERKSIRLPHYDYAQNGAYFVTICTLGRKPLFWPVGATCGRPDGVFVLSEIGIMADNEINRLQNIYENVTVDKYVIMPNHIHMIIMINHEICGRPQVAPTVSRIVQQFKGTMTKQAGVTLWQHSFFDRIIRSEPEYRSVWKYIDTNPAGWQDDDYYTSDKCEPQR